MGFVCFSVYPPVVMCSIFQNTLSDDALHRCIIVAVNAHSVTGNETGWSITGGRMMWM